MEDNLFNQGSGTRDEGLGKKSPSTLNLQPSTLSEVQGTEENLPQPSTLLPQPSESEPDDGSDDDFDTPYRPAETIRLPFRESDFPVIMRQLLAASPANLNVIFSFCREINGEKKNFCLVTNPRKKLKYRMFTEAES